MRHCTLFATLISQLFLVLFCSAWCWQPAVVDTAWLEPPASVEHLTEVCDVTGVVETAHPYVHIHADTDDVARLSGSMHGIVKASPPFPLPAAKKEFSGESEVESIQRTANDSLAAESLRFPAASFARPPTPSCVDAATCHQIAVATPDPAQTSGPRPPPAQHRHA